MKLKSLAAVALVSLLSSGVALATTENTKTIQQVGVQTNGLAYVLFKEPLAVACSYSLVYVDLSTTPGKGILAVLLSAQSSGTGIARIDYTQGTDGTCIASIVTSGS